MVGVWNSMSASKAFKTGRHLPASAYRAATAPRRSLRSLRCVVVENLWVPFLENGLELREKSYTTTLLALRGVLAVAVCAFFNSSKRFSRKGTHKFRRSGVSGHRVNDLATPEVVGDVAWVVV